MPGEQRIRLYHDDLVELIHQDNLLPPVFAIAQIQRNPGQCRGITLGRRLQSGLLVDRSSVEVPFSDQVAVLDD